MAGLQGRMFGGYQLVEQFPAGGIADVYRGSPNKPGGREVVVKVIYPEFARQPGFLPRFRHIVEMSSRLASHPHVLPLLAHGEDAGYLYLVTPYVESGTLRDWQRQGGRMSLADVGPFFRQLCDALGYAHSLGVVHGNLKPSNVFLFEGRHVLLGDFGMLWDVSHMDMNHAGSGTDAVEYLAPEVLSGQVTQLSDIYSLGAMLFSAAAGHAPFHGGKPADVFAAHARQPVPALAQVNPALAGSAALDPVIQRAMAKRPEDRFPSAAAVAQAIDVSARQAQTAAVAPATAPVFGTAPVAPGFAPLSAGLPGMQPPQQPQQPAPIAPVFGAPVPAPLPGAAGMLGAGPAAAALGSTLGQLDPPFPPLPASAQSDERAERMEQGALSFPRPTETGTGIQPTIRVPAPNIAPPGSDVPLQQTMHVPAPQAPAADASFAGLLESSPQLPAMPSSAAPSSTPPGKRPYSISGAPAAKLGGSAGLAGRTSAPPFHLDEEDADDDDGPFGHQMLQAIRPGISGAGPGIGGIASAPGFAVAGGAASGGPRNRAPAYDAGPPSEAAWTSEGSAFGPGESREWRMYDGSAGSEAVPAVGGAQGGYRHDATGWNDSPGGAHGYEASGWTSEQMGFGASQGGGGYSEELRAQALDGDGRPFSPTQLGLPRLTSPVLVEQPPSFHDILSESNQLPRYEGGVAVGERAPTWNDAGAGMWGAAGSAPLTPWRSNPPNGGAGAGAGAGAGWEAGNAAWGSGPGMSGGMPPAATPWDQPAPADGYASSGKRGKPGRFGRRAEPEEDSGFDDERVWTVGTTAVRAGRGRWVRKVALFLLLVLLVDMAAVVVARPDLCPTSSCKQVSAFVHQKVPFLHGVGVAIPAPFVAVPTKLSVNAISGKTATAPFVLTNLSKADIAWKASAALPWLTLNPASGTLSAGAHQPMVVTAKPIGVKPGSYSSNVTVTTAKGNMSVPITIAVAAGALLNISPTSLTFTACGTSQPVTIKNAGATSLKFTAVPSQDSALSLDTTSGTLGPGQSRAISVTLLCAAVAGNGYTVNIISDSGSAVVTIHYT